MIVKYAILFNREEPNLPVHSFTGTFPFLAALRICIVRLWTSILSSFIRCDWEARVRKALTSAHFKFGWFGSEFCFEITNVLLTSKRPIMEAFSASDVVTVRQGASFAMRIWKHPTLEIYTGKQRTLITQTYLACWIDRRFSIDLYYLFFRQFYDKVFLDTSVWLQLYLLAEFLTYLLRELNLNLSSRENL